MFDITKVLTKKSIFIVLEIESFCCKNFTTKLLIPLLAQIAKDKTRLKMMQISIEHDLKSFYLPSSVEEAIPISQLACSALDIQL